MTSYQKLKEKPSRFLALTGYTVEEFLALLPHFSTRFLEYVQTKTLSGKPRKKRSYSTYKNSPLPSIEDKLLFILIYLRKAMTQDVFGELFGMAQPVANKWIHLLLPVLNETLANLGELPSRETTPEPVDESAPLPGQETPGAFYFHDGTERPINRPKAPKDQKAYYSGKKKQHTLKNNLVIDARSKVVVLTPTCEGKKHDKKVADEAGYSVPVGSHLYQDTGFQGFDLVGVTIIQPKKKPKGGELTAEEKEINRSISSIRIRIEHAIGGVKRFRIIKDKLRNWKKGFGDLVMETCCGLHNYRLNFRPWRYETPLP